MRLLIGNGLPPCLQKDKLDEEVRLFRPVLKGALVSEGNWVEVSWQAIKGAESYSIAISKDTFKTILQTLQVDTTAHLFEQLEWEKSYQFQVRANAKDTVYNSKWSILGIIKTPKFPTILNTPGINDVSDEAVRVSWTTSGAAVTSIKILKWADSSLVKEVPLTNDDVTKGFKIIPALAANTQHIIFLYSGAAVRGWANFTTKQPFAGTVIDLRNITATSILRDTLPDIPSGSIVLLQRGMTYLVDQQVNLAKTVTLLSGDDLTIALRATIAFTSNFNFETGSNIDSLVFRNVIIKGGAANSYANHYLVNATNVANVGKINIENCQVEMLRGILRIRNGSTIGDINISDCIIDSISGYSVVALENATTAQNIAIRRSTIYKAEKIIASAAGGKTALIEDCTINEAPFGGNYVIDYASTNLTAGITMRNCIIGIGKSNAGNTTGRGIRAGAATTIDASNNYSTFDYAAASNPIPNLTAYSKTALQLWNDPINGDFTFKDNTFPGRATTGDPRWRK
ncbi:DUF5123 domain-containing protein [Paraflavitalea speifideaquila]|uniref:DUF5123 domain-containing protein n=1 Tax=Paraflavitalea speifideaquila TaxID=3076558 RepID=UPI0028EF2D09|nr:DUF5123 domain-containing protein [Paraflavitalea speifideiaquila]